jgi:hypothetical protein
MGARGNSGVILSQILRGFAKALENHNRFNGSDFASALESGSETAYRGVGQPVEGTMLTVIREAAAAAKDTASTKNDLPSVLKAAHEAARVAVDNTPNLLSVLKQAGVVDAGGQGLLVMLEGMLSRVNGSDASPRVEESIKTPVLSAPSIPAHAEEEVYGYCTEYLIQGENLNLDSIREHISSMGKSAIVVGDENTIRVHVHTLDPGSALSYSTAEGILSQIRIQNMDEQHREYLAARTEEPKEAPPLAAVAVVPGPGIGRLFQSFGASIVSGGQSMNPSAKELIEAVDATNAAAAIILPNNKNVVMAANQASHLSNKEVRVVPSRTVPQGVAALLALNSSDSIEDNLEAMEAALESVKTVEITTAIRSSSYNGLKIEEGDCVGLINGELTASGQDATVLLQDLLAKVDADHAEIITLYYGEDVPQEQAESVAEEIRQHYPEQEIEIVDGGQPHYQYIVSVE